MAYVFRRPRVRRQVRKYPYVNAGIVSLGGGITGMSRLLAAMSPKLAASGLVGAQAKAKIAPGVAIAGRSTAQAEARVGAGFAIAGRTAGMAKAAVAPGFALKGAITARTFDKLSPGFALAGKIGTQAQAKIAPGFAISGRIKAQSSAQPKNLGALIQANCRCGAAIMPDLHVQITGNPTRKPLYIIGPTVSTSTYWIGRSSS